METMLTFAIYKLFFSFMDDGDVVLMMSDGIHDNLDPQTLGLSPHEACPSFDGERCWTDLSYDEVENIKEDYQTKWLQSVINKHYTIFESILQKHPNLQQQQQQQQQYHHHQQKDSDFTENIDLVPNSPPMFPPISPPTSPLPSPSEKERKLSIPHQTAQQHAIAEAQKNFIQDVHSQIMDHCESTTYSSRDFMESNPSKELPNDYKLYPGKMDHTTLVIFCVGSVSYLDIEQIREEQRKEAQQQQAENKEEGQHLLAPGGAKERELKGFRRSETNA
mmetsp:Transcript_34720/g.54156  ORF Transcript_34720/g.54156 Transcript_34720/m.54156 type:complete len:277 (-) Transcript_34720:37-867(-)